MVTAKTITKLLIEHNAMLTGNFKLASGATSSYYIDVKTAITSPMLLKSIADSIAEMAEFDIVAGVAVGGVPLCVATSLATGTQFAIIRAEAKGHGIANTIIGDVKGRRVLLVEDVTTSGGSALYGVKEIRAAGGIVDTVITVVDRCQGADETLGKESIHLIALSTLDELLEQKGIKY